jgi:hypothetical protein
MEEEWVGRIGENLRKIEIPLSLDLIENHKQISCCYSSTCKMPRSRMLSFLMGPNHERRTSACPVVPSAPSTSESCRLCGRFGHTIVSCCSPEKQGIQRTLDSMLDIYEGKYAYVPEDDMVQDISDKFDSYDPFIRLHRIEIYCILIGNITLSSDENDLKRKFIHRVKEIRRAKIRNETVEQKTLRIRHLEQYHHGVAMRVIHEQNRKLAFKSIWNLYEQIKIQTVITEQNRFVNTEIVVAIENAYKEIQELKIKIKQEIEEYRAFYSDSVQYREEKECLNDIVKELKIDDTDLVKVVRERGGAAATSANHAEEKTIECPICYNHLAFSETYYTNCSHPFCFICISTHLSNHKDANCPCCRTKITKLTNYTKP